MTKEEFINRTVGDWDAAMGAFFENVERRRLKCGVSVAEVRAALNLGFGRDVGDQWDDWTEAA